MTIWSPDLTDSVGPTYRALATAIGTAIDSGELTAGDRLPTHRDLAAQLGIALTTVTRGYAEAERRGLVRGEVGRGTFVRARGAFFEAYPHHEDDGRIDLRPNSLLPHPLLMELGEQIGRIVARGNPDDVFGYGPHRGTDRVREAGAIMMDRVKLDTSLDQVLVTAGAQHAMAVVLGTILDPGDTLLVANVTYAGMKALANFLHIKLVGLPMDDEGILPDAFRKAVGKGALSRALYCMSTLQNPTSAVMSADRRREIAAIAEETGVPIVEDDSYGFVLPDQVPISAQCSHGYYLTGVSKSLLPSLRVGFVRAPLGMVDRLEAAISSTVYLASPLTANVVAEWVDDGTADRVIRYKREELAARQAIARDRLGHLDYSAHPSSPHGWLRLPDPWTVRDFIAQSAMRGVDVMPADEFSVGRETPYAVRICVGPPTDRAMLEHGVRQLAEVLDEAPEPRKTVA